MKGGRKPMKGGRKLMEGGRKGRTIFRGALCFKPRSTGGSNKKCHGVGIFENLRKRAQ
jgi:hypothetical protein